MSAHVKIYFLDWIENRISRKEEIERHLQECDSCCSYYDKMTKLLDPGVISDLPRLIPDPFMPTRIVSLAAEQKQAQTKLLFSKIRLSLEGLAFILAVLIGIVLGKSITSQSPQYKTDEILGIYNSVVSPEDLSTQMELILDPLKGDHQ